MKAFDFLASLLSQTPRVVSRERIRDRLWPGTFISESTLATVVNEVRAALGDDPKRPRFIRTVRGHGYAFLAETVPGVPEASRSPRPDVGVRLVLDDREVALREGENLLGRVDDGVVWIDAPTVSRRHARIRGERLAAPVALADGDENRLGQVLLTFRAHPAGAPTRTAR